MVHFILRINSKTWSQLKTLVPPRRSTWGDDDLQSARLLPWLCENGQKLKLKSIGVDLDDPWEHNFRDILMPNYTPTKMNYAWELWSWWIKEGNDLTFILDTRFSFPYVDDIVKWSCEKFWATLPSAFPKLLNKLWHRMSMP